MQQSHKNHSYHEFIADFVKTLPTDLVNDSYLTGGAIRDFLTGKAPKDYDIITTLSATNLISLNYHRICGLSHYELFVGETSKGKRIEITRIPSLSDLTCNLLDRDFTANALAIPLKPPYTVIDLLNGISACKRKFIIPCHKGILRQDPIRVYRAFRFESEDWTLDPTLLQLLHESIDHLEFDGIPVERFTQEMMKALIAPNPVKFFDRISQWSSLKNFLPQIHTMTTIPAGPLKHHPEGDLWSHARDVLTHVCCISDDPVTRFCALFHDLGKLQTPPTEYPSHHGHEEQGEELASHFCRKLRLPNRYRLALMGVCKLHGKMNRWDELREMSKLRLAGEACRFGISSILPLISQCDKRREKPFNTWETAVKAAQMSTKQLDISINYLQTLDARRRGDYIWEKRLQYLIRTLRKKTTSDM